MHDPLHVRSARWTGPAVRPPPAALSGPARRRRLDEDPWAPSGLLTTHVDRWELLMGAQRMEAARRAP